MATRSIGVVGAGKMGSGLVQTFTAAGHSVALYDHHEDKASQTANQNRSGSGQASSASVDEALRADLVVLALWYPGTVEFARAHSQALSGKIVVDIANPLDDSFIGLSLEPTTSAAEELAATIPQARVVKACNTITSQVLGDNHIDSTPADSFVAADDAAAKATMIDALDGTGIRALDAGALTNSRLLERLTAFGIELGQRYGLGFGFDFKYLPGGELTKTN